MWQVKTSFGRKLTASYQGATDVSANRAALLIIVMHLMHNCAVICLIQSFKWKVLTCSPVRDGRVVLDLVPFGCQKVLILEPTIYSGSPTLCVGSRLMLCSLFCSIILQLT